MLAVFVEVDSVSLLAKYLLNRLVDFNETIS